MEACLRSCLSGCKRAAAGPITERLQFQPRSLHCVRFLVLRSFCGSVCRPWPLLHVSMAHANGVHTHAHTSTIWAPSTLVKCTLQPLGPLPALGLTRHPPAEEVGHVPLLGTHATTVCCLQGLPSHRPSLTSLFQCDLLLPTYQQCFLSPPLFLFAL